MLKSRSETLMNLEPQLVDVIGWSADDFFATYPEGARDKRALFPPEDCTLTFINKSRRYLFKLSDPRYPEQYWGEIVASKVGSMVNVPVVTAHPAIDSNRGEAAALIEWFYEDGCHSSVLGGTFMQQIIPGFDMKKGTQHNLKSIRVLFSALQKKALLDKNWMTDWAKGLIFDSLIGNTDRHQNNWALLIDHRSSSDKAFSLAPWFDNGTSLGCERMQNKVFSWTDERLRAYLYNGKHHMRWDKSSPSRCGFFEMPKLLVEFDPSLRNSMLDCIEAVDLAELTKFLELCTNIQSSVVLSKWRADFMLRLIKHRQEILVEMLS